MACIDGTVLLEAQHFPDPMAVREKISVWTLHAYPGVLRAAMTVFDLPEAIAVSRSTICSAGSIAAFDAIAGMPSAPGQSF